ncbi:MAG TPA: hypothetical protein VGR32_01840 [Brevundimonas sp.]|jgi:hypothetical protein|uniref:hypothetical protein n=1 Tax=Brevundimonas sp. TaxID=1871086 RepID=UPI002DE6F592|nr:hypothetical protein [Brevundimonas sp.]
MRISIIAVAGLAAAVSACAPSGAGRDLTLAEAPLRCHGGAQAAPTGRQTGDARRDYACRGAHAPREANVTRSGAARSTAIDRAQAGRIN